MQLILKEDVENLGFKDDIVIVKNGYGRNYLIPNGKAIIATKSAIKVLNENLKQKAFKEKKIIDEAKALADKIIKLKIKILSKIGSGNKLFGSVTNAHLAKSISSKGLEIDKKQITLPGKNIKRLGNYEATIRVHRELSVKFPFDIVAEEKK
jgi:large subunit ribosomal protein L9